MTSKNRTGRGLHGRGARGKPAMVCSGQGPVLMRREQLASSAILLLLAVWIGVSAASMGLQSELGPGPGFFPFWLSVLLGGFSVALAVTTLREPVPTVRPDSPFRMSVWSLRRVLWVTGAVLFFLIASRWLGYTATVFVILLVLVKSLGNRSIAVAGLVALCGSVGSDVLFTKVMEVSLPVSRLDFLARLSLF